MVRQKKAGPKDIACFTLVPVRGNGCASRDSCSQLEGARGAVIVASESVDSSILDRVAIDEIQRHRIVSNLKTAY